MSNRRPYILVADDDPDDREMLVERFLRLHPAAGVEQMANGYQVLDFLRKCPEEELPELLVVDYKMPGMTGAEVLDILREDERYRNLPKIVWSTSNNQEYIDRAMKSGADKYFAKPQDMRTFDTMVEFLSHLFQSRQKGSAQGSGAR
jgi:CheY-like chemotaxis protein